MSSLHTQGRGLGVSSYMTDLSDKTGRRRKKTSQKGYAPEEDNSVYSITKTNTNLRENGRNNIK